MEHAPRGKGGEIPYQLLHGDGPLSVPERFCPGRMSQHIPLPGTRLPPHNSIDGALLIPGKSDTLSPATTICSWRVRSPVCRDLGGYPQATMVGEAPPDVDISVYLAYY